MRTTGLSTERGTRLVFIDAARGVACLAVLIHHLFFPGIYNEVETSVPHWVAEVIRLGSGGVEIFFVISGFVIAYSLRDFVPSLSSCGRFILRRQIRLDPTYWCVLIPSFVMLVVGRHVVHSSNTIPGASALLLNGVYLQGMTHSAEIVGVAWTLCLEIQFYLVFITLLGIAAPVARLFNINGRTVAVGLVGILAGVSILANRKVNEPIFIGSWFYFAAGVLCYWTLDGRLKPGAFLVFLGVVAAHSIRRLPEHFTVFGVLAVSVFFVVGSMDRLTVWSGGRVLQYIATRSYSLYLVHLPIIFWIYRVAYQFASGRKLMLFGFIVLAAVLSIACAHLLHKFVERPTQRLAASLHSGKRKLSVAPADAPEPSAVTAV